MQKTLPIVSFVILIEEILHTFWFVNIGLIFTKIGGGYVNHVASKGRGSAQKTTDGVRSKGPRKPHGEGGGEGVWPPKRGHVITCHP